ncbi:MAG: phosphohistidine phosphatase SixA [Ignavibacteriales bacterium]|nr:phosphohistidine phosphatase SixA [Ignavibacteriales bacterium]
MNMYFLRHGDAVESPHFHDTQRPLSEAGKKHIHFVAHFLRSSRTEIELILSSPLIRARETAEIIRASLDLPAIITTDALIAGSAVRELFAFINTQRARSLLLVGHEPQLSSAISVLTGGDDHFRVEMKKASLAHVETPFPVKKGQAVLSWLLTVAHMESMR